MEKQLPADIDAERSTLGALLIDREAIVAIAPWLFAEYFYLEKHAWIYEAILDCYNRRVPPDVRTVSDALRRINRLDPVGGLPYLVELSTATPTAVHVEYYARIVERTAVLRRLIQAGGKIAALGYDEAKELEETLDKAEEMLFTISQRRTTQDFVHIGQVVDSFFEQINYLQEHRGDVVGVPTKFRDLDELTGGLQKSDLIILAARPSVGKCLTAQTLIDDPATGERLMIEECVRRRLPLVFGVSVRGKVRPTAVGAWIDSGVKPCYRVTTRTGRSVEVTGHHPFLTSQGWVPLHDLAVGVRIAVPHDLPAFGRDERWPLELVRLLAYLIAEGGVCGGIPCLTTRDPAVAADFMAIVARFFPTCTVRQDGSSYRATALGARNPLTHWLARLGLDDQNRSWTLPRCVWTWTRCRLAEFLRAYLSCDGAVYPVSEGYVRIECAVGSQRLAADLQHALIRFGVVASYYCARPDDWWIEVSEPLSVERYQRRIGWLGEKQALFAPANGRPAEQLYAQAFGEDSGQQIGDQGTRRPGDQETQDPRLAADDRAYLGPILGHRVVKSSSQQVCIQSADLYWDEIQAIEAIGQQRVYDLTVPDGANFIAQDICVHNTAYALQLGYNVAMHSRGTVGIFSLEMSREQLVQRILAMHTGIDSQKLRSGALRDSDLQQITEGMGVLSSLPLYIDDTPGLTITEVRSKSRRLQAEAGVDLIIIDYLQLMQGRSRDNRVNEISEISRGLKGLARELDVPVIALSQLSRAVESRTSHVPMLSDLRESGCLAGESLVYLPDKGCYRRIDQLVGKKGFNVLALNTETWQLEPHPVLNAFATGRKPVFKLTTRLCRTIRATANHKFLTIGGWHRLDELTVGQRLALPRHLPNPTAATMRDEELGLLGHLIGDGCTAARQSIHSTTHELALAELVADLATSIFGDTVRPRISRERSWYQVYLAPSARLTHGVRNPNKQNLSRDRAELLAQVARSETINKLAASDVYWDEIVSIEPDGEEEVYDLTVEGLHNFIVNDIVSHNSIEQDADIVMFIYREEIYDPNTDKAGIAEIHIAKHRNGPVGVVPLRFDKSINRFVDLERYRQPEGY